MSASEKVFQNVYLAAPPASSPRGTASFRIHKTFYGVTGTGQELNPNVVVNTGDYQTVKLAQDKQKGTHLNMTAGDGDSASFIGQPTEDCDKGGNFEIECDNSFHYPNPCKCPDSRETTSGVINYYQAHQFIGLGAQDPNSSDNIVPVAVFAAQPGTNNYIAPVTKYYVSWGTYSQGEIIDITTVAHPASIDFTGKASNVATVVHDDQGKWTVSYN